MTEAVQTEPNSTRVAVGDSDEVTGPNGKRRAVMILTTVLVVALLAGGGIALAGRGQSSTASTKTSVVLVPVKITKQDLATYTDVTGTLGYGAAVTITEGGSAAGAGSAPSAASGAASAGPSTSSSSNAKSGSSAATTATTTPTGTTSSNTVTQLAAEGSSLNRGDVIYAVDSQPRVLMYGPAPAWRDLSASDTPGVDIYELKQNLIVLGYDPDHQLGPDNVFDSATIAAVDRWQYARGYDQTGIVKLGQMVFLPGPVLVASHTAAVGSVARTGSAVTDVTVTQVVATALTPTPGTLSSVAPAGAKIAGGTLLFSVDGRPTVAMTGTVPVARRLSTGVAVGDDVRLLETNLVALGFDPQKAMSIDGTFDDATGEAVKRWQTSIGVNPDGVVPLGAVIVVTDASLVVAPHGEENGSSVSQGRPVLDLTGSRRQVTANVSVADRAALKVGDPVQVKFADASQKPGHITAIGAVAAKQSNNANAQPTVVITVALDDPSGVDPNLVSTPVDVLFVKESVKGAFAVPTSALIALKEGGFAVQLAQNGVATRLVPVTAGLYSNGLVQITGNDITEGSQVLVTP